jgi:hypothetical protein
MRALLVVCALVLVGCERSDAGKKSAGDRAEAADESSLSEVREQACACKDQDCVDRVRAELLIERRRFETAYDEAEECMSAIDGAGAGSILGAMRGFKDKVCACRDKACVENVEKEMMEWAMKNMDKMKDVKPTKAQDEAADKIEDEMDKCKERLEPAAPPL